MKKLLQKLIWLYQATLSGIIGPRCRFYPSCSHYAIEALERHGAIRGSILTISRVCRCHPFNEGGFDPVPGTESRLAVCTHDVHGDTPNAGKSNEHNHQELQSCR